MLCKKKTLDFFRSGFIVEVQNISWVYSSFVKFLVEKLDLFFLNAMNLALKINRAIITFILKILQIKKSRLFIDPKLIIQD
jgi:hypothetical protein